MLKTATRLAPRLMRMASRGGQTPATEPAKAVASAPEESLRGSGSWANEWAGARAAIARAAAAGPIPKRNAAPPPPENIIRPRPLMSAREIKLHNWIADKLEVSCPDCSLHAGVALESFLVSEQPDALDGLVADMLIADDRGTPLVTLIRDRKVDNDRQVRLLDALIDAELPVIDLPDKLSLSKLWAQIEQHLPGEAAVTQH
ncbi:hypothetical protein [Jannaschia aquimarina]|uniref:hypothetical protein n=1 Tax=Jannaschia aquimarina TaxID=935700 RepID=UPI001131256D|nr:hypothetical protein [Jannaschia aquimarina]